MKKKERKDYIKAVRCLFDLPSVSRDFAEGARTRHDDFVATHINQTLQIHQTVSDLEIIILLALLMS
jgi:tyrosinase